MVTEARCCDAGFEAGGRGHKPGEAASELEEVRKQMVLQEPPRECGSPDTLLAAVN